MLFTGIHPTTISESFEKAAAKAVEILTNMATPVALSDRESLLKSAMTSLSSKVSDVGNKNLSLRWNVCLDVLWTVEIYSYTGLRKLFAKLMIIILNSNDYC